MDKEYVVLGAGGHAKVVLDILSIKKECVIGLTDSKLMPGQKVMGYSVVGGDEILQQLFDQGTRYAAMGIGHVGNPQIRHLVFEKAKQLGFIFPNIIHPESVIASEVRMGEGNLIAARAVISPEVQLGDLCIVNTSSVIEHEVLIGNGVHIAPGAIVLGGASIGADSFVGAGSVILQGIHIGKNCIIGAGSVVLHDVEDDCVMAGNPALLKRRR